MKTTSMISMSLFTTVQKFISIIFTSTLSRQRNVTIVIFYYQHNILFRKTIYLTVKTLNKKKIVPLDLTIINSLEKNIKHTSDIV